MWKFNESTQEWEWIENSKELIDKKNRISQLVNPSSGLFEAIDETYKKEVFETQNPNLKYSDYFENTSQPRNFNLVSTPQRVEGKEAEKLQAFKSKYNLNPYIKSDIDDLYGELQTTSEKWVNGSIKFVGKGLTAGIGGLAMLPGLIYGAATGSFKNIYDNDFQKALDKANELMDENLPNYLRKEVEDYNLLQKIVTANFWANDVLSGMSFVAGAVLTETISLGLATPFALARTVKFLKALQKGSKIADARKLVNLAANLKKVDNVIGVGRQIVTGSFYEAGVESRHFVTEAKENFINDYIERNGNEPSEIEIAQAMDKIYNVANGVFALNSALVGMSNVVTLPKTFGPKTGSTIGKLFNIDGKDKVAKGLIETSKLSKRELARASKNMGVSLEELKKLQFIEKSAIQTRLQKAGKTLYKLGEKPFTEGIWEEMMQGSVNKGALDYVSKYLDEDNKLELYDLVSSLGKGMAETYGSQEGWEEGIIGMIIGSTGFAGPSSTGKGIGWQGSLWDALKDPLKTERLEYLERANSMTTPDRIQALIEKASVLYKTSKEYNESLEVGDMFNAKNEEHEAFFSDVNFRMKLGNYEYIEDNINDVIDNIENDVFSNMFGYENSTEKEIQERKNELKTALISKARTTKENINKSKLLSNDKYIQDALAYNLSAVSDIDNREKSLSELVSTIMGTVDSRSVMDIIKATSKLTIKKIWLDDYSRRLKRLESAKKRLITMQLSGTANQERIDKQQEKVNEIQKDITSLEEKEFNDRKTNALEAPEYLRDFDSFRDSILKLNDLAEKVEKHYLDNPSDRKNLGVALRDLEKLAQRRENFVNEINMLMTKEGSKNFIDSLEKIKEYQNKGYLDDDFLRATIVAGMDPDAANLKLIDIQNKALQSLGYRLQYMGVSINDSSNIEEAINEEYDTPKDDGVSSNLSDIEMLFSDTVKQWITDFEEKLPPSFDEDDSINIKIAKSKSKQDYVKRKLEELEKLIKDTIGTEINEQYQTLLNSNNLQNIIAQLDNIIANLKSINKIIPTGLPVIENSSKFGQLFIDTSFVPQEDIEAVEALTQKEIYQGIYIKIEDYPDGGKIVPASNNSVVKVQKGIVGMEGKGAVAYININGKEVKIGGLLDPRRFIMSDGTNFNPYNYVHLSELNSSFLTTVNNPDGTQNQEASNEGLQVQTYYNTLLSLFEELKKNYEEDPLNNEVSTSFITDLFYVNKNSYYNTLKEESLEDRPDISTIPDEGYGITYNYETVENGVKVQKQNTSKIIIRRSTGEDFKAYAKKDGKWVLLQGNESSSVLKIYQEQFLQNNNYNRITGQYVMMINKPNNKSDYSFISIGFPAAENKKVTTTNEKNNLFNSLIELIKTRQEEIESSDKKTDKGQKIHPSELGITFKDYDYNNFFISLLSSTPNEDGTFKLSSSITASIEINMYGSISLVLEIAGINQKQYIDLYISVDKNGKLIARFGDNFSEINSYDGLIKHINNKISYYALKKGNTLLLDKGNPLKVGGFFSRVDKVSENNVVEKMEEMRLNVNLTSNIELRPKSLKEKVETNLTNTQNTPENQQNKIYIETVTLINSILESSLKNNSEIIEIKNYINTLPISPDKKKNLNILLDNRVASLKLSISDFTPLSSSPVTDAKADIKRIIDNFEPKNNFKSPVDSWGVYNEDAEGNSISEIYVSIKGNNYTKEELLEIEDPENPAVQETLNEIDRLQKLLDAELAALGTDAKADIEAKKVEIEKLEKEKQEELTTLKVGDKFNIYSTDNDTLNNTYTVFEINDKFVRIKDSAGGITNVKLNDVTEKLNRAFGDKSGTKWRKTEEAEIAAKYDAQIAQKQAELDALNTTDTKADVEQQKEKLLEKIYDAEINELENGTFELIDNQGAIIAEAKTREELEDTLLFYKNLDNTTRKELAALESTATSTPASSMTEEQKVQRIKEIEIEQLKFIDGKISLEEYNRLDQEKNSLTLGLQNDSNEPAPFSISPTEAVEKINMQTAETNLARMLNMRTPENPNGIFSIQDVKNILTNVKNNGITWGAFFNNVIYLSKKAGVGTEYHEAFHAVFRTLLSPTQINAYYSAAIKQYGSPTNQDIINLKNSSSSFDKLTRKELEKLWLEEQMAEGFKSYAVKKDSEKPKGLIGILFDKIKKLLGIIKDNQSDLDLLFQDIYSGKFKNSQPYNSLVNFKQPVFSLIKKKKAFIDGQIQQGYFNSVQSERIINTIASRALNLEKEKGKITESDIYNLISDMATNYYSPATFKTELQALVTSGNTAKASKILSTIQNVSQSLQEAENIKSISEEVNRKLSLFNIKTTEEEELEDYFDNEVGERNFDQNVAEIGGFGTLSSKMRQFIAFTTESVDEFGFGEFADLSQEKFRMSSNAFRIYTGVERVLANTPIKDMLPKLKAFAENNSSAYAFYNHLTSSINSELHSLGFVNFDCRNNEQISIISRSSIFSNFASAFSKNKVPQIIVIYDPKSNKLKAYRSNVKDDSSVQVDEWTRNFINNGLEDKQEQTVRILNEIEAIFNDETLITSIEELNKSIDSIQKLFLDLGISVSKGYIKYSLISKNIGIINEAINTGEDFIKNYYINLMSEFILFQDIKGLTSEDITEIRRSIVNSTNNNPFVKKLNVEDDSEQEDTGAIGRFKKIASANSIFDETISAVTFQNSEGKSIYTYIQPSYLTNETEKWKKRANSAQELIIAIKNNEPDKKGAKIIMDMMIAEGTPYEYYLAKNMYQTIKNNPYILGLHNSVSENGSETININTNSEENFEFSTELLKNLSSYIIDGMRVASLEEIDVEGKQELIEQSFKGSSGNSYGSLDGKSKFILALSLFADSSGNTLRKKFRLSGSVSPDGKIVKNKERVSAPIVVGVNSEKKTQNAIQLPVQKFSDSNGNLTELGVQYIYNAFLQEYIRIGNVQDEVNFILNNNQKDNEDNNVYDIEDYHYVIDKKTGQKDYTKGRGHDFFQFKELKKYNSGLYITLLEAAKQKQPIPNEEEIKQFISNNYAPNLFNKYVKTISNSRNRLITEQKDTSTKETAKGENISSTGSELAKKLTNPGNNLEVEYKGTKFRNAEHAYQTWKSGEFDEKAFNSEAFKPVGSKPANKKTNYQTMVEILVAKLEQHPTLIQEIKDKGGLSYIVNSTHEVKGDKFWESTGQDKFIQALRDAYQSLNPEETLETTKSEEVSYKNRLLPEYYQNNDGTVDMAALSNFFFNDFISSMTYNMLINGDYAMLFRNPTDVVKRNSRLIASGPSLGNGVTRVAIVRSITASNRFDKNSVKNSNIEDLDSVDTTDGQNLGTLNWYINKYLMSSGKLPKEVARIYEKMEKGYRASLAEVRTLKNFNALVSPRKIVGVNRYFYDKTSIKTLLRSETSYMLPENRQEADELYDRIFEARRQGDLILQRELYQRLHSLWGPIDSARANHDLLNKLELENIDLLIYDSALKTIKPNIGSVEGNNTDGFTWSFNPILIDDDSFREQVKTDSIKSKIVDPTQLLNTVFSEQKLTTKTKVLGKSTTLKNVVETFEKFVAERSKRGFEEMRKTIISGNIPRYKYLLNMFKDNLMLTGADPYLIEMVSESLSSSDGPEFNLNMPSTIDKLESMFLSYISKNTLKVKAPGHKFTLISDFGSGVMEMNGKIITDYEFQKNPKKYAGKVSTRRLEFRKKDKNGNLYTEIKISAQFAEHLGLKPGDNIPSELLEMFGVRIPTQDKHSMGYFKIVDFLPMETGNQIMLPYEILKLSGADFDIDAEFVRTFDFFTLNNKPHWFGQYLKNNKDEESIEEARQEYIREKSQIKDVKKERDLRLQNHKEYQSLRQILKETNEQLKKNISKERLSSYENILEELNNVIEDYFNGDEVSEDNSISNSVTGLPQYSKEDKNKDVILISATLKQIAIKEKITLTDKEIAELKDSLKRIKKSIRSIETKVGIESLEQFGYFASESNFSKKFGKIVINNKKAYEKGDFKSINPITISEINNLLIPLTGVLIYNNSNEAIGNTITSTKNFDSLEEILNKENIVDETILEGIHDANSKNAAAVANDTGKENIGPAAVFNLMFQRLHKYKVKFNKEFIKNNPSFEKFIEELSDGFELSVGTNGEIINNQGVRVNDLNDQIISAMTDNGKDPKAARFNLSYSMEGAVLLRIGMGESFNITMLTQKQEALVNINSIFESNKSELETEAKFNKAKIFKNQINYYYNKIKTTINEEDVIDSNVVVPYNEYNLIEALKYSQDPNTSSLNEGQYNYLQMTALDRMYRSTIVSDYLRNLSDLIGLARGTKPTFAENYNIKNSLKNLGIVIVKKPGTVGDTIDDYIIERDPKAKEKEMPMDVFSIIKEDKILSTNIKIFHLMLEEDSGKFFVLETNTAREMLEKAGISFKDNFLNYKENINMMRKSLLAFLSMKAYRKIKNITNPDINSLFKEDLINLHSRLLQKPEFKNNALLRSLTSSKIPFGEKNKSNLKGLTLYKLAFNSRTKNNPDYVERLIDDFKILATSSDPEAKSFAAEAFMYLMMKDAGLFKSDTFIRQIAPIFLKNISVGLDNVQELFSSGKGSFENVFGVSKEKLIHEYVELITRYAPNNFNLKGNVLSRILNVNNLVKDIAEIKELENNQEVPKEKVNAVIKEGAPIFYDNTLKTLTFNLKKGIKENSSKEEKSQIMGINSSILEATGLFTRNNQNRIVYPPFIQISIPNGDFGVNKLLFKLEILHKGNIIVTDNNGNIKTDPKYSLDTTANNLFASEMTGTAATYRIVNPYLEKSISPWFWTTNELELFRINRELEEVKNTDAEIVSAENINESQKSEIVKAFAALSTKYNPLISPSVTPAATPTPSIVSSAFPTPNKPSAATVTTNTPQTSSVKKSLKDLAIERVIEANPALREYAESMFISADKLGINTVNKILSTIPGVKAINTNEINQSKSSSKQPINQATLTNILDKLSNKFGISWKYDTSIPGLGQFKDGMVLINPNKAKLDTPFHEFAHPFIAIIKIQNPLLYKNLISQINKTEIGINTFNKVKKLYLELTYEQQLEETIVDLIGQYAAEQQSLKQEKGLLNAIKTFLRRVSEYLKSLVEDSTKAIIPSELPANTTLEELATMLVIDNPVDVLSRNNNVNYNLKLVQGLMKLIEPKINARTKKYGEVGEAERLTLRLNTPQKPYIETNIRKTLQGKGVPNNQINLMFDYMRANNMNEVSVEELITSLISDYSYTIEINIAKEAKTFNTKVDQYGNDERDLFDNFENAFKFNGYMYEEDIMHIPFGYAKIKIIDINDESIDYYEETKKTKWISISPFEYNEARELAKKQDSKPTQIYSNLTVPGGINYTENEIATLAITPAIKGHAQFATDKGIGWFRSDEQLEKANTPSDKLSPYANDLKPSKTRRILEVQSDLFQKGRDKENLISKLIRDDYSGNTFTLNGIKYEARGESFYKNGEYIRQDQYRKALNQFLESKDEKFSSENQFLQLLNKDNNWVTFFVKSIIQDSAKKGYKKVLFPRIDTIIQIESQGRFKTYKEAEAAYKTPEWVEKNNEFKKNLDEARKELSDKKAEVAKIKSNPNYDKTLDYESPIRNLENRVSKAYEKWHGIQPTLLNTANFYEADVTNILKKQGYNPVLITDEYGNTWNEIEINPAYLDNIYLQKESIKPGVQELFDSNPELANQVYEALGFDSISDVTLGKPRFNPDNPEATSYPIKINDKYAGVISVNNEGYISSSIGMAGVELEKDFQGKGYGTKVYLALANKLAEKGETLKSDSFGKQDINDSAKRIWKSLLDKRLAIDKGDYFEVISTITPQQKQQALEVYSQYLDTIFPDSQVKDIVYHGTGKKEWKPFKGKNFFTDKQSAKNYANVIASEDLEFTGKIGKTSVIPVVINTNPEVISKNLSIEEIDNYKTNKDGIIANVKEPIGLQKQFVVFEPEQIHILGSKQDIERFKEFVSNPVQRVNLDKPTTLFNIFANVTDSDVIELINNCN